MLRARTVLRFASPGLGVLVYTLPRCASSPASQPVGTKHLGAGGTTQAHRLGPIRQYVAGQDLGGAIYCVVDLHAKTDDPADLRHSLYDLTALLLAAGVGPARASSSARATWLEHTELTSPLCLVAGWRHWPGNWPARDLAAFGGHRVYRWPRLLVVGGGAVIRSRCARCGLELDRSRWGRWRSRQADPGAEGRALPI